MDKNELYQKIREILILSQYEHWVEAENPHPTADWIDKRVERAIDYYLGRQKGKDLSVLPDYKMTRFHHIVNMQVGLIIRLLESYLDVGFLEYCKERDDVYTNP